MVLVHPGNELLRLALMRVITTLLLTEEMFSFTSFLLSIKSREGFVIIWDVPDVKHLRS